MTTSSSSSSDSSSSSGSRSGASSSTSAADLQVLTTSGAALVVVYVLTVLATALPFDAANLAWGQGLSRVIVDAASLPLVGLALVRYSLHLRSRLLPRSGGDSEGSGRSSRSSTARLRERLERWRQLVKRLALAGVVGMVLLAAWQPPLFFRAVGVIDRQLDAASSRESANFVALEKALGQAPAADVQQAWTDFRSANPAPATPQQPAVEQQRKQLRSAAQSRNAQVLERFEKDAGVVRFIEGRDRLRVLLVALVYAAAFWAFLKRA